MRGSLRLRGFGHTFESILLFKEKRVSVRKALGVHKLNQGEIFLHGLVAKLSKALLPLSLTVLFFILALTFASSKFTMQDLSL